MDAIIEFVETCFKNVSASEFGKAIFETIYITLISTVIAYVFGIPLGVILYGTSQGSIFPNKYVNMIIGLFVNIFRSVPFIILLVLTQPFAKLVVGTKLGNIAFIFYLTLAAIPFVARMVESSLQEVDLGVIEAANAMGTGNFKIIYKVLLPEAKPSLLIGGAIAFTTILGYTPMTYLIGGGGLGNLAIRWGIYRTDPYMKILSSIMLIAIVEVFQWAFTKLSYKTDRRKKEHK